MLLHGAVSRATCNVTPTRALRDKLQKKTTKGAITLALLATQRPCQTNCGRVASVTPLLRNLTRNEVIALRVAGKVVYPVSVLHVFYNLSRNVLVIIALQVAGKIASCNNAFTRQSNKGVSF